MTSKIKVDNITNQSDSNIVNKCGTTITLGASGDTIELASGASQTGFGRTGTVDWDTTPKTATFSAVSGNGYFVNTTAGVITVNLPAGVAGAIVSLADYAATWQTNNVTVAPNGTDKIGSLNENASLNTEGQSVTFVYVDSTQGWINTMDSTSNVRGASPFIVATGGTITTCGDYKIHSFTGPGTFCVSAVSGCATKNIVGYQVVAGGGGSSPCVNSGGGGAGGFREGRNVPIDNFTASPLVANAPTNAVTVTATAFPIVIGGGGSATPTGCYANTRNGSNSSFNTIIATGGGGGGLFSACTPLELVGYGASGGSGGGGTAPAPPPGPAPGGSGNTPPVSPSQGSNGGGGYHEGGVYFSGGGGGGATAVGVTGGNGPSPAPSGQGGAGANSSITGSSVGRAGGGNGGGCGGPAGGSVGFGGGAQAASGTANTGGGGGAQGGAGGSGIVIIRYKFQ